jgi:hypothetical protein
MNSNRKLELLTLIVVSTLWVLGWVLAFRGVIPLWAAISITVGALFGRSPKSAFTRRYATAMGAVLDGARFASAHLPRLGQLAPKFHKPLCRACEDKLTNG